MLIDSNIRKNDLQALKDFLTMRVSPRSSSLLSAVSHIIGIRSKKQVVWTNASSVVTFMANEQLVWNISEMNLPTNSMS